jgi:CheY-like chemotaxis protein
MAIRFVQTPSVLLVTAAREEGEMYARTLRAAGYHASKAASSPAAFRMATIYPPNVVVTDAPISGSIDAVELTRRLRADVRTSAVRIIVLASKSRWNDADVALDAGADTLLEKPVPGHLLQSEIARLLAPRQQGAGERLDQRHVIARSPTSASACIATHTTCPWCNAVVIYRRHWPILTSDRERATNGRERIRYVAGWFCVSTACGYRQVRDEDESDAM